MGKCLKRKYEKVEAERLAKSLKRKAKKCFGHTNRKEKRAYFCLSCNTFHLTSMSQNEWELKVKKQKERKRAYNIKKEREFQLLIKKPQP